MSATLGLLLILLLYLNVHRYVYLYMNIYAYMYICINTYVHKYVCQLRPIIHHMRGFTICICIYALIHAYIWVHVYTYMYKFIHKYIHICINICMSPSANYSSYTWLHYHLKAIPSLLILCKETPYHIYIYKYIIYIHVYIHT
jgi:hypothetical protein